MTASTGAMWRRGAVATRAGRWIALAAWVAAIAVATSTSGPCTPDDPSICGPGRGEPVVLGLLFATPILLWVQLGAGYLCAVAGGTLDVLFDPEPKARLAFGSYALLCAGLLAILISVRRRQRAALPTRPARVERPPTPWRARAVTAGLLGCVAVACVFGYSRAADALAGHVERAVPVQATVRVVDHDLERITLSVPAAGSRVLDVLDASTYRVGDSVPVLVDRSSPPAWVQLVAEPEDLTWWQSFALVAGLLGALALVRPVRERLGPLDASLPEAVAMVVSADPRGEGALLSLPSVAGPLARLTWPFFGGDDDDGSGMGDDDAGTDDIIDAAAERWRAGQPLEAATPDPRPVLVTGEVFFGGRVHLTEPDGTPIGSATVRLPRLPRPSRLPRVPWPFWLRRDSAEGDDLGELVTRTVELRDTQLPLTVSPPRAARVRAVAQLVGGAALLVAATIIGHVYGFHPALLGVAATGWLLWFDGITTLSVRLVVEHAGMRMGTAVREHRIGWRAVYGVRESPTTLLIGWGPRVREYRFSVPDGGQDVAALIESLRQRAEAVGGTARASRVRLRPGLLWLALYPVAAALVAWYLIAR